MDRLTKPASRVSQFTRGTASLCCQHFFGTGEQSATGERCSLRDCRGDVRPGMSLRPGICCLPLCLLCHLGDLGRTHFWHVFSPATTLGYYSKGPARHTSSGPGWMEINLLYMYLLKKKLVMTKVQQCLTSINWNVNVSANNTHISSVIDVNKYDSLVKLLNIVK